MENIKKNNWKLSISLPPCCNFCWISFWSFVFFFFPTKKIILSFLFIVFFFFLLSIYWVYFNLTVRLVFLSFFFWLRWVFVAACRLSLVAESGGYSWLRCSAFSLRWLLLLWSMGSRCAGFSSWYTWALERAGSVVLAHGLIYSAACGIFPDQGSNPCPLHWQVDS